MFSALFIVLPVFALIATGWLARKLDILGPHATAELNRYVVYLAFPALLFDAMAHATVQDVWRPGFAAAYCGSGAVVFAVTVWLGARQAHPLADATIDGLNAGYGNTGYVGFPLALAAFGPTASAPATITMIFNGCILFSVALALMEFALQTERSGWRIARTLGLSLLRNPLLTAPVAGLALALAGVHVPAPVEAFLKLLGGTTACCALVALGLFIGAARAPAASAGGSRAVLLALKLLGQPAVAWLLAGPVLGLQPMFAHLAVLMAATPTGTGSFMLAELYSRDAAVTSDVVLLSTVGSILTLSTYLALVS